MSILRVIKAPFAVQIYRVEFLAFAIGSICSAWQERRSDLNIDLVVLFSLFGLVSTWMRISRSRWFLAVLGNLIPAAFFVLCILGSDLSEMAWWKWPIGLVVWFAVPVTLAVSLFIDKKTSEYFTTSAS